MELKLVRKDFTEKSSIGEIYINDAFECFTLEDKDRGLKSSMSLEEIKSKKQFGITAIPYGRYEIELFDSPHFKRILPHLKNVPGYDGVLIHNGNKAEHSEGCILVGYTKEIDFIGNSRVALNNLLKKIEDTIKKEKIFIEITK